MLDTFPFSSCCCGGKIPTSMDISELNFAQLAHPLMLFLSKNLMSVSLCCGLQLLALTAKYIFTKEGNQKTNINNSLSQSFPIFQFPQFEKSTFSLFLVNSLLCKLFLYNLLYLAFPFISIPTFTLLPEGLSVHSFESLSLYPFALLNFFVNNRHISVVVAH